MGTSLNDFKDIIPETMYKKICERYNGIVDSYKQVKKLEIKKVIFNDPATIVFWTDNSKTVVKCGERDTYDPEKGLAMCIVKRFLGNKGNYYNELRKWLDTYEEGENNE